MRQAARHKVSKLVERFVRLFAEDSALRRGFAKASQLTQNFGRSLIDIGSQLRAAGNVIEHPFAEIIKEFAGFGDNLAKMSQRTGASSEALSQLKFAAEQSGTSIDELEVGIKFMQRTLAGAAGGSELASDMLKRLGVSFAAIKDLTPDQQLEVFADAIDRLPTPAAKTAAAMDIFGRSGAKLLPLLDGGAANIKALREEAHKLGLTLTGDDAKAAADITDAFNRMDKGIQAVRLQIGAALVPSLLKVLEVVQPVISAVVDFVRNNRQLVVAVDLAAFGLVILGGVATATGFAIVAFATVASSALSILAGAWLLVKGTALAAWAVMTSPITGPLVVIAAIAGYLYYASGAASALGRTIAGEAVNSFKTFKLVGVDAVKGILAAMKVGDFQTAAKIAGLAVQIVFVQLKINLLRIWNDLTDPLIRPFVTMKQAAEDAVEKVKSALDVLKNAENNGAGLTLFPGATVATKIARAIKGESRDTAEAIKSDSRNATESVQADWQVAGASIRSELDQTEEKGRSVWSRIGEFAFTGLVWSWRFVRSIWENGWSETILRMQEGWTNFVAFLETSILNVTVSFAEEFAKIADSVGWYDVVDRLDDLQAQALEAKEEVEWERQEANRVRREQIDEAVEAIRDERKKEASGLQSLLDNLKVQLGTAVKFALGNLPTPGAAKPKVPLTDLPSLSAAVKGTFQSPNFAAQFGFGDNVQQRQLAAQLETNKKLDAIEKNTREGGGLLLT